MTTNQRQAQKWSSRIRELQNSKFGKKEANDKWKGKEKLNTPPNFLNASSPPWVEFIMFPQISFNHRLAKEFYHFVHILSPFGNELIKHKLREVDAMHEIKITTG
jgi:hypothetical protein